MNYYETKLYKTEIKKNIEHNNMLQTFNGKVCVVTGARGMIGSELIDTIMLANQCCGLNCKVYGIVRNMSAASERFHSFINEDFIRVNENVDYIIHGASNTHPVYYATRPIETILTNTVGTSRVLEFASEHKCQKFIFLSSVEVYGENRGDVDKFTEDYLGYLDSNTLRAGYPEGKRVGEALCQAYIEEKNLDCIIPRISRCYGPGLLNEDSKALSQFIHKAVNGEDIVLKSKGTQLYSYIYAADAVSAILFLTADGQKGEAYNLSGIESDITLAELAGYIAAIAGTKVIYDIPDEKEAAGYSKATKALLDTDKIERLGWRSQYSIKDGIKRTLELQRYK